LTSLTPDLEDIAEYIEALLNTNKATLVSTDGSPPVVIQDVWFGEQEKYPRVPCIAVEPDDAPVTLSGPTYRGETNFSVFVLIFHAGVQDNQLTRKQVGQIGKVTQHLLNADPQMGGLLISGFVANNQSGYVYRSGTMYRTVRLTYTGMSKVALR
jgi:hypothetical protein